MNRLFLMTKSIICPLFLKGLAPPSASPNAGALILKRIGIRWYWLMVKLNWISVIILLALSSMMPCLCFLSANATLMRWEGWLLIVRLKLYSFQRKNSWLRKHVHRWLLHFPWRSVFWHFPYFSVSCVFALEFVSCWAFKDIVSRIAFALTVV